MAANNPHLKGDQHHGKWLIIICCAGSAILIGFCVVILVALPTSQNDVESHVTNALLTEFSYDEDKCTLHYNLALSVSILSLNHRVEIYCKHVEAKAQYEDVWFAYSNNNISPFNMLGMTSHYLCAQFKGRRLLLLDADQTSEYHKHENSGIYDIDVELNLITIGLWRHKTKICCNLKVPLTTANRTSSTSSSSTFQAARCHWNC